MPAAPWGDRHPVSAVVPGQARCSSDPPSRFGVERSAPSDVPDVEAIESSETLASLHTASPVSWPR